MQLTINPFLNTLEVFSEIDGRSIYSNMNYGSYEGLSKALEINHGGECFYIDLMLVKGQIGVELFKGSWDDISLKSKTDFKLIVELNINQPYELV
jgi:hypothetical protein